MTPVFVLTLLQAGCADNSTRADWWADGERYMVAADHDAASRAGAEILAGGGNAVDAAVATSFALAVVRPQSCGLGGGGFMIIHRPGQSSVALDYRETAPAGATVERYLDGEGRAIPARTRYGAWAVAVPGTVKGLLHAHERYGSGRLSRREVLAPAVRLAGTPLTVDAHFHDAMQDLVVAGLEHPEHIGRFAELYDSFLDKGRARAVGQAVDRRAILPVLAAIADRGADGFYAGPIAAQLISEIQRRGGPMTMEDLAAYEIRAVRPLLASVGPCEILAMPPPSSGGAVILQILNVLSLVHDPITRFDSTDAADVHLLIESMKHAFAQRATLLGDRSPQVLADVDNMISADFARDVLRAIDRERTKPTKSYGGLTVPSDGGTSHFCIVDDSGMAVACTETINLSFGSRILVPGTGIVLNNEIDDFAVDTRTPNAWGLRQSTRNLIHPGRRPLSSMSPTIVLKNGKVELLAGASGGPKIISATLQVILNVLARGMTVDQAVTAPRIHHQWMPDCVRVSRDVDASVTTALLDRGHVVRPYPKSAGCVQAIQRTRTGWRGACDPAKGGKPAGR